MATLDAICISERKGTQKSIIPHARLLLNHGIEGDAHAGEWHRQVSLLAHEDVEMMRGKGLRELKHGDFGENLVIRGLELGELGLGSRLRVGASAELSITQIGKTCHHRCAIYHRAGDCIMPSRGIFARVVRQGEIAVGDPLELLHAVYRRSWQAVVLTISDRCSRGTTVDTAGPAVAHLLGDQLGANLYACEILPDEKPRIEERLRHYAAGHSIDLVITVGGTGFAPRDVTPEAVTAVIDRPTPGLDEAMRQASLAVTPRAMLSRAVSGIAGNTLIVSLPGSERGATQNLAVILPELAHGLAMMRGESADCGRPAGTAA